MCEFQVKLKNNSIFKFKVASPHIMFAGSRYIYLPEHVAEDLLTVFGSLGFCFSTGCCRGVDESFRKAFLTSEYKDCSIVACAFLEKALKFRGLHPMFVVPRNLPPKVALAKRTTWLTARCSMLVLFPSSPIGRGSRLAFNSTIMQNKPVFVCSTEIPKDSDLYTVYPSSLFDIVEGYWCVPPVYQKTGLCCEVF